MVNMVVFKLNKKYKIISFYPHLLVEGEGGILVTNNDNYADKLRLIRNHAEVVVEGKGNKDLTNII